MLEVFLWEAVGGGGIDDSSPGDLRLPSYPEAGEKWDAEKSCTVFCD